MKKAGTVPSKQRPSRLPRQSHPDGLAVDHAGGPVIDPTENVVALVHAEKERADDLRELNDRRLESNLDFMKETMSLRAEHQREMRGAESSRLNSIRQVDQANVQTAADRQLAAIQTLAAQTATNAETLRSALTSTAAAIAVQTANTVALINERIGALEKSAYTGQGKEAVADPVVAENQRAIQLLLAQQATGTGRSQGQTAVWGFIALGISLIVGLLAIGTFVFITTRQPTVPNTIYVPSPAGTMLPTTPPQPVPR